MRPDSWSEHEVTGISGVSFIADYKDRDKSMVQYLILARGEKMDVLFSFRIATKEFEQYRENFDTIVASYRMR